MSGFASADHTNVYSSPLLELRSVTFRYGEASPAGSVLREFSISLEEGELLCVLGRSGCGKSTLLKIAGSFLLPDSGGVLLDGYGVTAPDPERVMVFQEQDQLFPWKRTIQNVAFGLTAGLRRSPGEPRLPVDPEEKRRLCLRALEEVGLSDSVELFPHQLSGGMRQRVALARAFVGRPRLLLMDEPFGSVDAPQRRELQLLLRRLLADHAGTALFVTHDVEEALLLGSRIIVMGRDGAVKLEELPGSGTPAERRSRLHAALEDAPSG